MTRRIAVEIGNATAKHCKMCLWRKGSIFCYLFYKKMTIEMGGDVRRCTACRKSEIKPGRDG